MRNFMEKIYHLQYSITATCDTTPTQATEEPQNAKMPRKDFNLTVLISIDFPKRLCNSDKFKEKCQEKESNALDEGWLKLVYCLDSFDYHWVLLVTQLYYYTVLAILQVPVGLCCLSVMWNRPLPSSKTPSLSKWGQVQNLSYENEFYLHENKKSFPYNRLST